MDYQSGHVMTLANSIIGVGILAMPYCFKQCGVVLSIIILLVSSIISRLACHFLLKSAILARRKTFEFLAFHIFGSLGKFAIEVGMIGFLLGTAIAFFVVMGDLGPEILSEMTGARSGSAMRNSIQVVLAVFCVLPLGLLRNVDSLNGVSKATIGFYCCLVLKIIIEALPHLFSGDWLTEVVLWRPAGILQCLPIFSMALFCQTQLFEIYQSLPNASLEKMNSLIRVAVNICTSVYIFVGAFGYIAFFREPFTGNILLSFRPSMMSDVMKTGFVLSLAFSFPLVIFPCRASLFSLLYKGPSYSSLHEGSTATNYIPEGKFKMLTALIVFISLVIGIMIPNIELVLGLVGSTIGVMICVLFPVTCFICISPKNTNERLLAQVMLFVGIIVMVLGTYANLYAFEEAKFNIVTERAAVVKQEVVNNPKDVLSDLVQGMKLEHEKIIVMDIPTTIKPSVKSIGVNKGIVAIANPDNGREAEKKEAEDFKDVKHEPPQPEEPMENQPPERKKSDDDPAKKEGKLAEPNDAKENQGAAPITSKENEQIKNVVNDESKIGQHSENEVVKEKQGPVVEPVFPNDEKSASRENGDKPIVVQEIQAENTKNLIEKLPVKLDPVKKNDEVDVEAIKKEDTELKEQEKEKKKQDDDTNQKLIDTIRKQNEVQQEIVEQQKKLIEVIQKQQENANINVIDKERLKAVKQIESIARKAIESIQNQDANTAVAAEEEKKHENVTQKNNKKSAANPAPLSYQLGLNQEKLQPNLAPNKINLVPIPLAFAKSQSGNTTAVKKFGEVNKTNVEEAKEINQLGKNVDDAKKEISEDSKLIRRDILSDSEKLERAKRDVREFAGEVSQVPVTETSVTISREELVNRVCEEIGKATTTEKPLIKMLCKLSDPGLVSVDLKEIELQGVDLKPQKRDLKHVVVSN